MAKKIKYDASSIRALEGLDPVRARPGMYIGGTGKHGFHHLLWEIIDNAVDEALNGHATDIEVIVDNKEAPFALVEDNGRGIPFDIHPKHKRPAVELAFTTLHAGGKFDKDAYKTAGGLHGVGASVVNALSEELRVTVWRGGSEYNQDFKRGRPGRYRTKKAPKRKTGTRIWFRPDTKVFGDQEFDLVVVRERIKSKAYLTPGVKFTFNGEPFCFGGGLADLLIDMVRSQELHLITSPFTMDGNGLQVALVWVEEPLQNAVDAYANGIPTRDGGTHLTGLRTAVVSAVQEYAKGSKLLPRRLTLAHDDYREGLVGALHLFVDEPQFQGQTKDRLNNPEARAHVAGAVRKELHDWLLNNQQQSERLVQRIVDAARARYAASAAAASVKRKSAVKAVNLPGKLADCTSEDVGKTELFIVEGDSAGGSAKQGRNREFQAILPLRGKVLNVITAGLAKGYKNAELKTVVEALGCGAGKDFDIEALRYGKVILLMDADVDGYHISTLMLAFFHQAMPGLIAAGRLYVAQPPLYRVRHGGESFWALTDAELEQYLGKLSKKKRQAAEVSRFKGLGEMMPKTLYQTTMDPRTRHLLKVTIPDGEEMMTAIVLNDLMGPDVSLRLPYIQEMQPTEPL